MGGWHRVAVASVQLALQGCSKATVALQLRTLYKSGAISITMSVLLGFQFAGDNVLCMLLQ